MFERFTDVARRLVVLAQEEARQLQHNYIGTEHLLLGMLDQEGCVAARVLASYGLNREKAGVAVEEIVGRGSGSPGGHMPFTPRAKKVLELSLREAIQLNHNHIGSEHILLGLIREGEGVGAQVLRSAGADLTAVRQRVVEAAKESQGETGMGVAGGPVGVTASVSASPTATALHRTEEDYPLCPVCASPLGETLQWKRVSAASGASDDSDREAMVAFCSSCGRALGLLP